MWALQHPWWEYVVRSGTVYAVVFVLLRVLGKKQIGQLGPFDLVLLLIISEAVSSALTGGDNSLGAATICVSTFVVGNYLRPIARSASLKSKIEIKCELIAARKTTPKRTDCFN